MLYIGDPNTGNFTVVLYIGDPNARNFGKPDNFKFLIQMQGTFQLWSFLSGLWVICEILVRFANSRGGESIKSFTRGRFWGAGGPLWGVVVYGLLNSP